jgi:hypothetical protein
VERLGRFALENALPLITWAEVLAPLEGERRTSTR